MRAGMWVALAAVVAVAGCSTVRNSRLNPVNWFGSSSTAQSVVSPDTPVDADGRVLVAEVAELHIERTKGGAIIRAVGVPTTQGWYQAELVRAPGAEGELVYRFVLNPPPEAAANVGAPRTREITAAAFVTDFDLSGVTTITVTAERNARSTRRG